MRMQTISETIYAKLTAFSLQQHWYSKREIIKDINKFMTKLFLV